MYDTERERVRWALEALPKLLPLGVSERRLSEPEIWILAHGLWNAFYSIRETLRAYDKTDRLAFETQRGWQMANKGSLDDMVFGFRNLLTHQGAFSLTERIVTFPATPGTDPQLVEIHLTTFAEPGRPARAYTMGEWIFYCFTWLGGELEELSHQYDRAVARAKTS
jgi:hypothetical protein